MSAFMIAALMLSVAAYIHTVSGKLGLRLDSPSAELLWRVLSFAALLVWVVLILRGFTTRHWSDPTAALFGSFALNWWFGHRGPKPGWPVVSMLFSVVGLGLATYSFLYE
ncbi:hypothetical protein HB662_26735 [Roseomonas frigidaquae]|uniref:Uncharacterized protein n=1 Tax=Falsiroseomonas frigidaquae TaxID=487318 RepID=A0ABX1F7W5_9PROT|nr:hypothetical protein [Falsiroseomonas frigidaquae]NKE48398.1 hypothetical protein [Falsiroseomonas frigidaquae]